MTIPSPRTVFALLIVAVLGSGCAVSDRQVIEQADSVHKGLQPAVITDPQLANYLQQTGERIIAAAKEAQKRGWGPEAHFRDDESSAWMFTKMRFHFVNSQTLNAFTTGGEHMYIYTGLLQTCATEDELVAVMAHEFAHVYCRHVHEGTKRQQGVIAAAIGAGVLGAAVASEDNRVAGATAGAGLGAAGASFLGMGFTRKDEHEADRYGFYFYVMGGWDPNRFGDFFQRMVDLGHDTTPEMMSDHPTLKSRVEFSKQIVKELPKDAGKWRRANVATPQEFEALKRRATEIGKNMPSDQTLAKAQQLLASFPSCVSAKDNAPEQVQAREAIQKNINR